MKKIDIKELNDNGFCTISNAINNETIDKFNNRYKDAKEKTKEPFISYLPSREEYLKNETILNFINTDLMQNYITEHGGNYSVHLSEARIGSSNINWHRDFNENLEVDKFQGKVKSGRHYLGMLICLEDFGPHAGCFEIVPTSHTWNIDGSIVNYQNMMENPAKCYSYYEKLIEEWEEISKNYVYKFSGKKGDVIFWYGSTIHRGAQPNPIGNATTQRRDSLILHFSSVPESEINKSLTCDEKDIKYLAVPLTAHIYQTIHSSV